MIRGTFVSRAASIIFALVTVGLCAIAWLDSTNPGFFAGRDLLFARLVEYLLAIGSAAVFFLLQPVLGERLRTMGRRLPDWQIRLAIVGIGAFLGAAVVWCGRRQFGGFDFSLLIQVAWRQYLGQRPYVDFITTTPPGFNLGTKYAFWLFGPSWNALLYFTALYAFGTFLWIYWLLREHRLGRVAAAGLSFAIEILVVVTLSFWWYNNSTLAMAIVYFLSALLIVHRCGEWKIDLSYVASLSILLLMKPNIAGVLVLLSLPLVLFATERKGRLLTLTICSGGITLLLFVINHISIAALLHAYRGASVERGRLSTFGLERVGRFDRRVSVLYIAIFSLPLISLVPYVVEKVQRRKWHDVAFALLFPISSIIAIYGVLTNGEIHELDCGVLLAANAVLLFGMRLPRAWIQQIYAAILFGATVAGMYYAGARLRVQSIDNFYQFHDNHHLVESGFLKDMRVSGRLVEVEREIGMVKSTSPGPYYFGPRIDFNYAVLEIPAAEHLPAWWEPGSAFARSETPQILSTWQNQQFKTLIFLREDYTYYPERFRRLIQDNYQKDDSYPLLTIYRAKH